jgi:hypothetical protein
MQIYNPIIKCCLAGGLACWVLEEIVMESNATRVKTICHLKVVNLYILLLLLLLLLLLFYTIYLAQDMDHCSAFVQR